ncbi:Glycerophosphoryl diester phosphodiesterase [Shimia gijangensis]|uniref:Glycerophosphoryl diester phosphodiesterase n=1 Tax=Shimia gijangensis TaxID=1470563 RepID=A0A1M6BPY3_9RHOB|nr:glycerophosphodiester phosphodiesterase family protein [Shimia gijangensis]SHI50761.1 Glycerophosphoryl diester phosphodiesterase [Shimia gijangensis]
MLDPSFLRVPLAHRALHDVTDGRPENSRAAILAAISAGYGIEIDLQLSSDGQAMVFHDYALERLTGRPGAIRQHDAVTLQAIPLTGDSEGIPTFSEVLAIVDGQVPLLVELKDQDGAMGPNVGPLEQATANAVRDYNGPLGLMSFNPHSVAALAKLAPDVPRGLVTDGFNAQNWPLLNDATRDRLRDIPDFDRVGACFISHQAVDLKRDRVAELKHQGIPVLCWTVRSEAQEKEVRQVADNITFESYLAKINA